MKGVYGLNSYKNIMIKEQMNKLKKMFNFNGEEDSKRKIENLVVFVIILIITIIIINMILKDNKKNKNYEKVTYTKTLADNNYNESLTRNTYKEDDLQTRIETILSNIEGVGESKVLITYSQSSQTMPLYNEDTSISDTEEKDSGGGTRKISENNSKKEVIYQEINGEKIPVTQSTINPKIEGAVVLAKGASNSEVKLKITQAVEAATGIPTHKIQVFQLASK